MPRKFFKILFKVLALIACFLVIALLLIFAPLDREPYVGTPHETKMKALLDTLTPVISSPQQIRVGWAKVPIVPSEHIPIASYGIRKKYDKIHDSVWCRAFVFKNKDQKAAFVTLDLLIFPPDVLKKVKNRLHEAAIPEGSLFLSAVHTHNGPGGWAEGLGGRVLAGPYNEEYTERLAEAVIRAIKAASANASPASIGYGKYKAGEVLYNRLSKDKEDLDDWLRVIRIKKENGSSAAIVTYAGHANILSSKINDIGADYPGALTAALEALPEIDFAAFAAGAVGTHNCRYKTLENYPMISHVASYLSSIVKDSLSSIPLQDTITLSSMKVPLYLRDPQLKVAKGWKIRPWVFHTLFGKQEIYISVLKVNDIVLIGTPCDFAGDLVKNFSSIEKQKHIHPVITSFNGGYAGYILPDSYYELDEREPRDMDWFGPHSGSYITEVIQVILRKF